MNPKYLRRFERLTLEQKTQMLGLLERILFAGPSVIRPVEADKVIDLAAVRAQRKAGGHHG